MPYRHPVQVGLYCGTNYSKNDKFLNPAKTFPLQRKTAGPPSYHLLNLIPFELLSQLPPRGMSIEEVKAATTMLKVALDIQSD